MFCLTLLIAESGVHRNSWMPPIRLIQHVFKNDQLKISCLSSVSKTKLEQQRTTNTYVTNIVHLFCFVLFILQKYAPGLRCDSTAGGSFDTMAFNKHNKAFNHVSPGPMQLQFNNKVQSIDFAFWVCVILITFKSAKLIWITKMVKIDWPNVIFFFQIK